MSNLENSIKDCISKELEKGIIEKIITEKLENCIADSLNSMFSWGGEVKKVIEENVKSVMIPYLESYDYSQYITKLDSVLVDVLKNSTLENRHLLENFKELMNIDTSIKCVKVSEIFDKWCEYVSEEVNIDGLEVEYDDGPSYESVDVSYEFEEVEKRRWLSREEGRIIFECEHDEEKNVCIDVYRYSDIHKDGKWSFRMDNRLELSSLRNIDKFTLYLMSLNQAGVEIEIDEDSISDDIVPEKEPEAYFE